MQSNESSGVVRFSLARPTSNRNKVAQKYNAKIQGGGMTTQSDTGGGNPTPTPPPGADLPELPTNDAVQDQEIPPTTQYAYNPYRARSGAYPAGFSIMNMTPKQRAIFNEERTYIMQWLSGTAEPPASMSKLAQQYFGMNFDFMVGNQGAFHSFLPGATTPDYRMMALDKLRNSGQPTTTEQKPTEEDTGPTTYAYGGGGGSDKKSFFLDMTHWSI